MSGRLTTHALDLVGGCGAQGMTVRVRRLPDTELGEVELDAGGRGVLAAGDRFQAGVYELLFLVGDYHRRRGLVRAEAFLDEVPIRFRVSDSAADCHVPLLVSLYGFSSYRGV